MTTTIDAPAAKRTGTVRVIAVKDIRRDGGTQFRAAFDSKRAGDYAALYKQGARFPYLDVFEGVDDREGSPTFGEWAKWLAAGFHRLKAQELNGAATVTCNVYQGSVRAAILHAAGSNSMHGKDLQPEERRAIIRALLSDKEWCNKSDRWIHDVCKFNVGLISKVRSEMEIQAKMKIEEERIRHQQEPAHPPGTVMSDVSLSQSDNETSDITEGDKPPSDAPASDKGVREARDGHGGTRLFPTANINKNRGYQRKPVRVETETSEKARRMEQIIRSIPKAIVQAKMLGWTLEQFIEECKAVWEQIPLEQGTP